jgi:hypothetical protein
MADDLQRLHRAEQVRHRLLGAFFFQKLRSSDLALPRLQRLLEAVRLCSQTVEKLTEGSAEEAQALSAQLFDAVQVRCGAGAATGGAAG